MNPTKGIYLRGEIYWLSHQRDGRRVFLSLDTKDLFEAMRRAHEIRQSPAFAPDEGMAREVQKFLAEKVRLGKFSRATERVHGAALREFAAGRAGSVAEVNTAALNAHYRRLQSRVAETTAQLHLRALGSFFSWCVKRGLCRSNPAAGVELARIRQPARLRFATKAQRDKLIADAPTDDLRFILFAGFHAGLRKNEIIEARASWFDLIHGPALHIENTDSFRIKDNDARTIPLTSPFATFLQSYLHGREPAQFALRPGVKHGKGTYRYDFHRPFNDYLATQGLRWITAHVMRHTFASLLAQQGVSIFKIASWLGDGVAVVQKHYAHLSPTDADIDRML